MLIVAIFKRGGCEAVVVFLLSELAGLWETFGVMLSKTLTSKRIPQYLSSRLNAVVGISFTVHFHGPKLL